MEIKVSAKKENAHQVVQRNQEYGDMLGKFLARHKENSNIHMEKATSFHSRPIAVHGTPQCYSALLSYRTIFHTISNDTKSIISSIYSLSQPDMSAR